LKQTNFLYTIGSLITIEDLKKEMPPICEKYRIAYVDAFGSIARSEQKEDSDIDLIIEFSEPRREKISNRFFGFLHDVEDRFQRRVDLLTENSLRNPFLKDKVDQERLRIYGS
jgi:predicted nucleotidyltransferase